jgi:hypothetical protein
MRIAPHRSIALRVRWLMLDLAMLAGALLFFAISVGYAVACDRL